MQETLMWVLIVLSEAFLLSSGILGFLLWRARKVQRQLRAELVALQSASQADRHTAPSLDVSPLPLLVDAALAETDVSPPHTADLNQMVTILEDRGMAESMERLDETTKLMQQHVQLLLRQRAQTQQEHEQKCAGLLQTFTTMEKQLEASRQAYTRLQHELKGKKLLIERSIGEAQLLYLHRSSLQHTIKELRTTNALLSSDLEGKERLLQQGQAESEQHQQPLRREVHTLQTTLATCEADMLRLHAEKNALADEYTALSKEYDRIFSSFVK